MSYIKKFQIKNKPNKKQTKNITEHTSVLFDQLNSNTNNGCQSVKAFFFFFFNTRETNDDAVPSTQMLPISVAFSSLQRQAPTTSGQNYSLFQSFFFR